jgi:hypothetical protein
LKVLEEDIEDVTEQSEETVQYLLVEDVTGELSPTVISQLQLVHATGCLEAPEL